MDLSHLNDRQREAVTAPDGPALILAGPGSGKTRVLTYRVAHLVKDRGISPRAIMAVTFTNKAAREMKERLGKIIGEVALAELTIGTFHAVCARILRVDGQYVGLERAFVIFDTDDQTALVKQIVQDLNLNDKLYRPAALLGAISNAKNDLIPPEAYTPPTHWHEIARRVYERYQAALLTNNAVDFDDLLMKTVELLRDNPAVLDKYRRRYAHILVDEFQDTNGAQYQLVRLLAGDGGNLFVVGDEDQCLPAGTAVATPDGPRPIESLAVGETVTAAHGRGAAGAAGIERVREKVYHGPLVNITTRRGYHLRATPNHMLFARLGLPTDRYYVYLMYRRDKGYRVGLVQGARSDGVHPEPVSGLRQRGNQEHADKLWLLRVCDSRAEAQYYEALFAAEYGLPTAVFHTTGRRMALDHAWLDRLYREIDTETRAQRLMADLHLYADYPHHRPKEVAHDCHPEARGVSAGDYMSMPPSIDMTFDCHPEVRGVSAGNNLSMPPAVDMTFDCHPEARGVSAATTTEMPPAVGMTLDCHPEVRGVSAGDNRRDASYRRHDSRATRRLAHAAVQRGNERGLAAAVAEAGGKLEVARSAFLTETRRAGGTTLKFDFQPASHIHPTMIVPVLEDGHIVDDEVVTVEWLDYEGRIYDLDVAAVHNYVAGGIVVHNSIYSWRGADFRNVMRFRDDYPEAQVILLEQNYRSSKNILDAAQGVIRGNRMRHPKALWTEKAEGLKIQVYEAYNEQEEADFVVGEIQRLVARKNARYSDIAVMYRTNAQSRSLEDAFVRRSIPYKLVGSTRFYERREVKDVLAYLRLAHNPFDTISLRRVINVPGRGIGDKTVSLLWAWGERLDVPPYTALSLLRDAHTAGTALPMPSPFDKRAERALTEFAAILDDIVAAKLALDVQALLDRIIERIGYQEYLRDGTAEGDSRWENVLELRTVAGDYAALPPDEGLPTLLEEVSLVADVDELDEKKDTVTLLTLHAAKGLEYGTVFLVGLEEGILPHKRSLEDATPDALEEERRLAYVGMTRAQERLYLVYAFRRALWGQSNLTEPSRFLRDVPHTLVDAKTERKLAPQPPRQGIAASRGLAGSSSAAAAGRNSFKFGERPAAAASSAAARFRPGDKVTHPVFGDGTVLASKASGDDEEVDVIFKGGAKKLLGSYLKKK